ncbi:MAG: hypothetical protein KF778_08705 [Rhodocyclaceae bacterium]|nr:hypothetical protein [Rhodocyclaceae bacterium]MBX3668467.1 hypothetical protein [Rhodocyclaceae bacterium]
MSNAAPPQASSALPLPGDHPSLCRALLLANGASAFAAGVGLTAALLGYAEGWIAFLAGLGALLWVARSGFVLDAWFAELGRFVHRIEGKDYGARMAEPALAAARPLTERCNAMARSMGAVLAHMSRLAHEVASVANESSGNAQAGEHSVRQQRDVTCSAARSIEDFVLSLQSASDCSRSAAGVAADTGRVAAENVVLVEGLAKALEALADTAKGSATMAQQLEAESSAIGHISEMIAGIAAQTNLLSLNAAIEAARAGVHGQGFAVVADEVRKLADRTSSATKEIDRVVLRIRSDVAAMEQSMAGIRDDVSANVLDAAATVQALQEMNVKSQKSGELAQSIANAVAEQSAASARISSNVDKVAELAERNDRLARDSSDLARHLSQLAGQLRDTLAACRFE